MLQFVLKKIFGSYNERHLKKLRPIVDAVNQWEPEISKLSDDELKAKTDYFRSELKSGKTLDDILPESFAVVREASKRVTGMRHFDVQILGGIVLHQGKIAEMATGEGKTVVATLPVYLNALEGKGVHVVTVNDYLAKRDREWMGPIYEFLGLSIGVIQNQMEPPDRQKSYGSDITYGTNNEYGFDYLRDNMVPDKSLRVQRPFHYAIVDEVDSILIDEARTPLIISGPAEESTDKYYRLDRIAPKLEKGKDFEIDEKAHTVNLTEKGVKRCEELLNVENLYDNTHIELIHHINQALRAHNLYKRDVDYMVQEGKVVIVDEFTGRLMPGRRFSDGLHQALEAKEGVRIERENQTLGQVTFQNYFRMYSKLGGMTGTAITEAVEFEKIYKLDTVIMPTNRPCLREDQPDAIYKTERGKFKAVARRIAELHKKDLPVLVGTISIEKSEYLSNLLRKENLNHTVLNAKYHEKEAEIITRAGQPGSITIATNMAGRGTDIVLGEGVADNGGLHVVGTERHESRRVDNQLRGRCARQGDPGASHFFISLEDDLMRIFGSDKLRSMMDHLGMKEDEEIQHGLVSRAIEQAQKRVEGRNFDIRKHLLEYDDVMNRQREIIYEERRLILESDSLDEHVLDMMNEVTQDIETGHLSSQEAEDEKGEESFLEAIRNKFAISTEGFLEKADEPRQLLGFVMETLEKVYYDKKERLTPETLLYLEKSILLQVIDAKWKDHLRSLDDLREGIGLRAYGQRDPLVEYKREAFQLFDGLTQSIKEESIEFIFRVDVVREEKVKSVFEGEKKLVHEESQAFHHSAGPEEEARIENSSSPRHFAPPSSKSKEPSTIKRESPKVGRNDPCPCGSGKKHKKCCGA